MDAKLVVVGGEGVGGEYPLTLPVVLGRSRAANIKIPQALVSRRHCELIDQDGELVVRDLNSLNGTFVGSDRITQDTVLSPGALLTVGNVTFRVDCKPAQSTTPVDDDLGGTVQMPRRAKATVLPVTDLELPAAEAAYPTEPLQFDGAQQQSAEDDSPWLKNDAEPAESENLASNGAAGDSGLGLSDDEPLMFDEPEIEAPLELEGSGIRTGDSTGAPTSSSDDLALDFLSFDAPAPEDAQHRPAASNERPKLDQDVPSTDSAAQLDEFNLAPNEQLDDQFDFTPPAGEPSHMSAGEDFDFLRDLDEDEK